MSKYTSDDIEVASLEKADRVNFEFDMLNHDVEKNVELSYGASAVKRPQSITETVSDWRNLATIILMSACALLMFVAIVLAGIYLVLMFCGDKYEDKRSSLFRVIVSCLLLLIVVFILFTIFNKMKSEMNMLVNASKVHKSIS